MKLNPPTWYEVEKLAAMAQANRAELERIKAAKADGHGVPPRRVIKLQRAVKAQARMERDLERRAKKAIEAEGGE